MSDTDSLDYLQTGFDPSSLTVPRLRSILVSHDIDYPSGAKKGQLVDIFTDKVVPQSRKILNARAKVRRMSKGIANDGDSQDDEEDMPPPQKTPKPRAASGRRTPSRGSRAVKVEESEEDMLSVPARTPAKRGSSKHARISDTSEDGLAKSVRKTRKSESVTPAPEATRHEVDELPVKKDNRRESAFTYDNPFQSGSSPPVEPKRKSLGTPATKERRKASSSATRRRTETPQIDDGFHPPTSATFEVPVSALNGLKSVDDHGVEAFEDFTPEAQMELVRERSEKGIAAVGPLRPRPRQATKYPVKGPLSIAVLTLLGAYAGWYRQEKLAVGYCGIGRGAIAVVPANIEVPDWLRILAEPQCETCPQHAYCSPNLGTECDKGFDKVQHPLSLGGLIPVVPTCEPNGETARKVKALVGYGVEELRERRAKFECGDLVDEEGIPEPTVEIDADKLKKVVKQKKEALKRMSEADFEELWSGAIGEIKGQAEVVSVDDGPRTLLTSTSLARLTLACSLRRSVRNTMAAYRLQLGSIMAVLFLFFYSRRLISDRRKTNAAIPQLVSLTLDRLATQAALHSQDREIESYISIGQLRDDVLRDEHSISKRERVWQKVRAVVEENANIRPSQRETRNGEVSRVWEWIGAVSEIEGPRRRRSGRVSWGNYNVEDNGGMSSPVSGSDAGPEMMQSKWAEGRPIY